MTSFRPGSAIRPGEYSADGYRVKIGTDGSILVGGGDSIAKYAKCLYGDARAGWSDFGRLEGGRARPLANPNQIRAGETLVHIPTFATVGQSGMALEATPVGPTPQADGEKNKYRASSATGDHPIVLYINGMNTLPETHAETAILLSTITEREVTGIYNATRGFAVDFGQCVLDSIQSTGFQLLEFSEAAVNRLVDDVKRRFGSRSSEPTKVGNELRKTLTLAQRTFLFDKVLGLTNPATASLFRWLIEHPGQRVFIVAHSQGNLVTSGALWALQSVSGPSALTNLQVYSLASPSPAWPDGINFKIKVYGHSNDLVPFADPKALVRRNREQTGDWRPLGTNIGLGNRHDVASNMLNSNFAKRIRSDLGVQLMPEELIKDQSLPYRGPGSKSL